MTPSEKAMLRSDWERIKAFRLLDKIALLWRVPLLLLMLGVALLQARSFEDQPDGQP